MKRKMTSAEVMERIRNCKRNLRYIESNMGIWGTPFASENASLKYWERVLRGTEPTPEVEV